MGVDCHNDVGNLDLLGLNEPATMFCLLAASSFSCERVGVVKGFDFSIYFLTKSIS